MGNKQSPRQERSRQRREALLRATIELLGETGAKSVTHRAVAERAGVPLASTTYYFESVHQLVEEALKLHVAERVAELQGMAAMALGATGAGASDIAERLAEVLVSAPGPILVAQYQMYLEAGRNPALQPAVADALAAFENLAAAVLSALGAREPEVAAEAFVALLDGFALHRLARPRDPAREMAVLFGAMRALFLEQVMDDETRSVLHARLRLPPRPRRLGRRTDTPAGQGLKGDSSRSSACSRRASGARRQAVGVKVQPRWVPPVTASGASTSRSRAVVPVSWRVCEPAQSTNSRPAAGCRARLPSVVNMLLPG